MEKKCVALTDGPPPAAPYSPAVIAGPFVFVSGQVSMARDGSGPLRGSIDKETRQTLDNLKNVLEKAGAGLEHVVKVTAFLADMNDFATFNTIYHEFFPADYPARTCIQAGRLPLDFRVEIEAIALLPQA